ncbi:MAG: hypothetical protein ACHQUC_10205 [Chlamydiales bacterium]
MTRISDNVPAPLGNFSGEQKISGKTAEFKLQQEKSRRNPQANPMDLAASQQTASTDTIGSTECNPIVEKPRPEGSEAIDKFFSEIDDILADETLDADQKYQMIQEKMTDLKDKLTEIAKKFSDLPLDQQVKAIDKNIDALEYAYDTTLNRIEMAGGKEKRHHVEKIMGPIISALSVVLSAMREAVEREAR